MASSLQAALLLLADPAVAFERVLGPGAGSRSQHAVRAPPVPTAPTQASWVQGSSLGLDCLSKTPSRMKRVSLHSELRGPRLLRVVGSAAMKSHPLFFSCCLSCSLKARVTQKEASMWPTMFQDSRSTVFTEHRSQARYRVMCF